MQEIKKACRANRFVFLICGLALSSWAPMIPYAKENLNLDEADLGLILLAFGIGALFMMPLTGWLVQRYGSKRIILIGGCLIICTLPFLTIASTSFVLGSTLVLFGSFSGMLNVSSNSQAVAVEVKSQKPLMSGFHSLFSLGGLLGAGFMSSLLEAGVPLFFCAITMSFIMMLILATQYGNLLSGHDDVKTNSKVKFEIPRKKVLILGVFCFIFFLAEGAMLDWSAVFLQLSHGYEPAMAGIGYAIFSVAMASGRFIGDKLIQRFGPITILQMGSFLAVSGFLIAVNTFSGGELVGFFLIGLGASNVIPVLFSAAGRLPDSSPSYSLTIVIIFGYTGILLGPALIGFVAQATTLSISLVGIAFLISIVGISGRIIMTQPVKSQVVNN